MSAMPYNQNPYSNCNINHCPQDKTLKADYLQLYFYHQEDLGFYDFLDASDELLEKTAKTMARIRILDAALKHKNTESNA